MNPANLTADQLKAQASQIDGMSDEQLKAAAAQAGSFNPMMANMDPAMMRQASQMMKNMSPEQMAQMQKMAANMMGGGMPGMPGAVPQMPQPQVQQKPAQKTEALPADQAADLATAEKFKNEANLLFKNQKYQEANEMYFKAVNQIRLNMGLRDRKEAKECELACRSNIALSKLNLKEYDHVVDQCEKVLEYDPKNSKASYRMAQAVFELSEGKSMSKIKSALQHAQTAFDAMKGDAKVKAFYLTVKAKHDELVAAQTQQDTESKPKANSTEELLLSRVKVNTEEETKEVRKEEPILIDTSSKKPAEETFEYIPTQPAFPTTAHLPSEDELKENFDKINSMGEDQLTNMVNQMKMNPSLVKAQYEAKMGCKLNDAQFDQMMAMMNPDMLKQSAKMAQQNPDLLKQAREQQLKAQQQATNFQAQQTPTLSPQTRKAAGTTEDPVIEEIEDLGFKASRTQSAPQMVPQMQTQQPQFPNPMMGMPPNMAGMDMASMMNNPMVKEMMNNPDMMRMAQQMMMGSGGPGSMPDASKMQEMMQNPSLGKILDNPDFLASTVSMLRNPMAKPQLDQVAQSMGASSETVVRVLEFLVKCAYGFKQVKTVCSYTLVRVSLAVLVMSYVLYWVGITTELLFMMPFK